MSQDKRHIFEMEVVTAPTAIVLSRAALSACGIEADCSGPFLLTKEGVFVIDGDDATHQAAEDTSLT